MGIVTFLICGLSFLSRESSSLYRIGHTDSKRNILFDTKESVADDFRPLKCNCSNLLKVCILFIEAVISREYKKYQEFTTNVFTSDCIDKQPLASSITYESLLGKVYFARLLYN